MGYFNFYIIKKIINSLFYYIKKNIKFIIIFIIFVALLFIREKCFAFDYNSTNYVEWYDTQKGKTYRVCSDNSIILIPKQSNRTALDVLYIYNGDYANVTVYENGVQKSDGSGSWILSNSDLNKGITPTFSHSGDYIAFKYDSSLSSVYEVSQSFSPFITNSTEIPSYAFTDLKINIANMDAILTGNNITNSFELVIQHNGTNYTYNINNYIHSYSLAGNSNVTGFHRFTIPKYNILNNVTLQENDVLRFYIKHITTNTQNPSQTITDTYNLGSYNMTLSGDSLINSNMNSLNNSIQQTTEAVQQTTEAVQQTTEAVEENTQAVEENTQAVEDLEDTITDDTVESTAEDLPTISVTDPTQSGIDSIFQSIYNAFCEGEAQDIVFPIPFTNKSITLQPNYVRDMLNNNGASWVYTLIQTFWAYLIGRYIVKDILNKITKIKSGNIENIENSNIKGDML